MPAVVHAPNTTGQPIVVSTEPPIELVPNTPVLSPIYPFGITEVHDPDEIEHLALAEDNCTPTPAKLVSFKQLTMPRVSGDASTAMSPEVMSADESDSFPYETPMTSACPSFDSLDKAVPAVPAVPRRAKGLDLPVPTPDEIRAILASKRAAARRRRVKEEFSQSPVGVLISLVIFSFMFPLWCIHATLCWINFLYVTVRYTNWRRTLVRQLRNFIRGIEREYYRAKEEKRLEQARMARKAARTKRAMEAHAAEFDSRERKRLRFANPPVSNVN